MAEYMIQDTTLVAIGDAIRAKNGETTIYTPAEMAAEITNLSIDLHSYTTSVSIPTGSTLYANPISVTGVGGRPKFIYMLRNGSIYEGALPDSGYALVSLSYDSTTGKTYIAYVGSSTSPVVKTSTSGGTYYKLTLKDDGFKLSTGQSAYNLDDGASYYCVVIY